MLRCMEHSLHLAAKHFVESITPFSHQADDNSGGDPALNNDSESDGDEDLDTGDSLGKAIALVKQVTILLHY
jgi:hypothetical protein